jgi:4-hydroxybutyrate dehydrogenase/sulfolactaldehyde 3-reductase
MPKVAFIGLGVMGGPMAARLARAGMAVTGYDHDKVRCAQARSDGVKVAASARSAAASAEIVITMLPEPGTLIDVLTGASGVLAAMSSQSLLIDMGTSGPDTVAIIAQEAGDRNIRMIDAPVGRPPSAARDGRLIVIAGGDEADLKQAAPLFEIMGEVTYHAGPLGSGARLKLINNYMSMVGMVMTAEALAAGRKAGLDREVLVEVLSHTAAGRGQIIVNFPGKVLAGDIAPDFPIRLGLKDLGLALDMGQELEAELVLGKAAQRTFVEAIASGRGEQDCTALLLFLEEAAGLDPSVASATLAAYRTGAGDSRSNEHKGGK